MDERTEARYLLILAIVLLVIGAWFGWAGHGTWRDRFDSARHATGLQVAWHGAKALAPYVVLAAGLWILPRRRTLLATESLTIALVTAIALFGYRADSRSSGRAFDLDLGPTRQAWQLLLATVGLLVASTLAHGRDADSRRP